MHNIALDISLVPSPNSIRHTDDTKEDMQKTGTNIRKTSKNENNSQKHPLTHSHRIHAKYKTNTWKKETKFFLGDETRIEMQTFSSWEIV